MAWSELVTRDAPLVGEFYRAVWFRLRRRPGDGRRRRAGRPTLLLHVDGRPVAGVRGVGRRLPRDRGAHWMSYFGVADADAAARQVTALGGRVLDRRTTPLRPHAAVADPEGAAFALIASSPPRAAAPGGEGAAAP